MVVCDNAGLVVSTVSHIIIDTNNVASQLLLGQEAAAS
jgi:hypothetical protein